MSIPGGISSSPSVSPQAQAFVHANVAHINQAFNVNNTSYRVISQSTQIVNGTNHFLTIQGQPDHQQYTITVHVPINGAPQITEVSRGHGQHHQGHSQEEHLHAHHHHDHGHHPHHQHV